MLGQDQDMAVLEEMDCVYKELIEQDRCRKEAVMPKEEWGRFICRRKW